MSDALVYFMLGYLYMRLELEVMVPVGSTQNRSPMFPLPPRP